MTSLLLKNIHRLALMDDAGTELEDAWVMSRNGVIESLGEGLSPDNADEITDLAGHVVIPGMVNTHHHLFQNLTRVLPAAQDATLFNWLKTLYPVWSRLGPEAISAAVSLGLAELALSGCTTSSDHQYIFPGGARLDDSIEAAQAVGVRFTATRGAMSIGERRMAACRRIT